MNSCLSKQVNCVRYGTSRLLRGCKVYCAGKQWNTIMASRHSDNSHTSRTFSSRSGNNGRDRRAVDDLWDDFDLPISRKGRFFDDSFFEGSRFDFDKKVNEILGRSGEEERRDRWDDDADFRPSSNFNRYRNLRSRDLKDDNQAMTVTSDDTTHKIVLDVQDFVNGEMKVKVVGELELAVEGRLDDNRTFRRCFTLPQNTDMDAIASVMSADGILTITAPQKGGKARESTANKGQEANQANTKERSSMSSESRKEGSHGRGNGSRHSNGSARTEDSRNGRSFQSSMNSSFRDVPFMKKGRFFDDSFFESSRFDFDKKINEILGRWGEGERRDRWDDDADLRLNNLNRYRNLRAKDLRDDNQAMTVTSDDTTHKIVLDVQDFVNGEMKVKVVGELELAVEGRLDDNRTFRRCFTLPQNTEMDAIASVMSADGILTITAPQKGNQMKQDTKTFPVQMSANGNTAAMESSATTTQTSAATSISAAKQRETQESEAKRVAEKNRLADATCSSGVSGESQQSSQSFISSQTKTSAASDASQTKDSAYDGSEKAVREGSQNKSISTQTCRNSQTESQNQQLDKQGSRRSALPITRRGQFFNDSYFEDTWKDYQDAVRDVLAKWDDHSTAATDDMTCYRKLRSRDMRDDNQAITSAEDSSSYKFVLDVHDFVEGGNISVNVVDETELVVEGQVERDSGDAKGSDHFLRRFILPKDVQLDSVSSVMSSDGVLTVIAPKKSSMRQVAGSSGAAEQESAVHIEKLSKSNAGESMSTASASATQETHGSDSCAHTNRDASSDKGVVIPVQLEASSDNVNLMQTEQEISIEKSANISDDKDDYKQTAASKDCAMGDSEADTVHKQSEEDGEEDESKSGMAALRKLLEEDESYIKNKNRAIAIDSKKVSFQGDDFSHWHEHFFSAVKEVLNKFHEQSSSEGDLAAYRQLRQRNLKLENQAAFVDENSQALTVVLDVYDFLEGKVSVEVKEGRELIVRGAAQRLEGTSLITLTFVRPFKLPANADLKNITACLTSDGVLLINVPRLQLPYDLPDLGGTKTKENRSRLGTPCSAGQRVSSERGAREASGDLDGVTYRISPHRNLGGDDQSSVTISMSDERQ
ncbi:Heat shock protein 22 [Chionoecetes opilio]|uniref:Heat shock protein 22 n=1 Tax=Chionoecetes opilio TaxID=41210 RepID=A0A8J5D0T7_CHIOP|nr:Heat shock protein 22 [Chionoecetes opilio]